MSFLTTLEWKFPGQRLLQYTHSFSKSTPPAGYPLAPPSDEKTAMGANRSGLSSYNCDSVNCSYGRFGWYFQDIGLRRRCSSGKLRGKSTRSDPERNCWNFIRLLQKSATGYSTSPDTTLTGYEVLSITDDSAIETTTQAWFLGEVLLSCEISLQTKTS